MRLFILSATASCVLVVAGATATSAAPTRFFKAARRLSAETGDAEPGRATFPGATGVTAAPRVATGAGEVEEVLPDEGEDADWNR